MRYKTFGRRTGLRVSELALGTGNFGTGWGYVAIGWLRNRDALSTTSLIPILGPRTREQLDSTLGALTVRLSPEQIARLDTASAIALGSPHEMIAKSANGIAGGNASLLDLRCIPVA